MAFPTKMTLAISFCRKPRSAAMLRPLAWRGGNYLDLLFFRLLGLPIPSLLAVSHVDLLGFEDDTGIRSKPS
jgi:hypothetical protein